MKDEDTILERMALSRRTVIELVLIAIVLSFGINLLATVFLNWIGGNNFILLLVVILCCLLPLIYTGISLLGNRTKSIKLEGFIAYNPIKKELIPVDRYSFSQQLTEYLETGLAENLDLRNLWETQPLDPYEVILQKGDGAEEIAKNEKLKAYKFPIDGTLEAVLPFNGEIKMKFSPIKAKENASTNLLCQATEYYLLNELSSHLLQFFTKSKFKRKQLTIYERQNVPSELLKNTFLELFSREVLNDDLEDKIKQDMGEEYTVTETLGGYRKLYLVLPKKSKVSRLKEHEIVVETKKIRVRFGVHMDGSARASHFDFLHYYLGFTNLFDIALFPLNIDISITIKKRALLSWKGWDYYDWVDSFLHSIQESVSESEFYKRINWESTLTMIDCMKRIQQALESKNMKTQEEG